MTDEEKKAIEYLKRHILPCYGRKGTIEFMLNDIVLNLIEKQSKEIEELKKRYRRNKTMNREPIEIRFVLEAPHTDYQSDINTLILRIDKLVKFYDNISNDIAQSNMDIDINNKNVECIQEILEHFKFKEC